MLQHFWPTLKGSWKPQESEKKSENKKKEKGSKTSTPVMNGTDVAKPAASPEQVEKLKEEIDAAVSELLRLKAEYKNLTGEDVAGDGKGKKDKTKEAVNKMTKRCKTFKEAGENSAACKC
ncbi:hypothetical protein OS493_022535 [Desmophyllum pertusum]|uniref:WHEP-TRS domain-containing protein n=1 Tax=Desmophyllum pertusum TaxID=174260 RepID=A0A9W9ZE68_9CNID|nr:hypothetical protein OS493_022535 [Desmophyllum pertusum]